jgi:hypothetical protein
MKDMKTPMQELIQTLKEMQESLDPYGLHEAIEMAESMLEKEKEQIMDAYWDGGQDIPSTQERCEQYYNETFKTK